jgi:hypothetical protein
MNAVYAILGWLLGLLSPHIIELVQRPYRRVQLCNGLCIELIGLRRRMARPLS